MGGSAGDAEQQTLRPLAAFIRYLRQQQGFEHVGFAHYVRLEALVGRANLYLLRAPLPDADAPPAHQAVRDLKLLLCPIFATSREQQDRFSEVLDDYLKTLSPSEIPYKVEGPKPPATEDEAKTFIDEPRHERRRGRWWPWVAAGALLLLLLTLPRILPPRGVATPLGKSDTPTPTPTQTQSPTPDTPGGQPNANSVAPGGPNSNLGTRPPERTGTPAESQTPGATPAGTNSNKGGPPPGATTSGTEAPDAGVAWALYLYALVAVGVSLLGFCFYEGYKFFRRQQVLDEQLNRRPPVVWEVETGEAAASPYAREDFDQAMLRLRRRQVAEFDRLDVPATVAATLRSCGFPILRYKPATRVPEYLILIDRDTFLDHQAQLFSELAATIAREELYTVCYFFDDPRLCCDEAGNYVRLSELQEMYGAHRLLVFSDGAKLLDPITGQPHPATQIFRRWEERAVLTPRPAADWRRREYSIASDFILLPAKLEGLAAVVDYFDATVRPDLFVWRDADCARPSPDLEQPGAVGRLRSYMSPGAFMWLCACAVYPQLQWGLTLHLGALLSGPGESLVTEETLLELVRLPWFRAGSIPDEVRAELIAQLSPEQEARVRQAVLRLMEGAAPSGEGSGGTIGEVAYKITLVAQRWLRHRDRESLDDVMSNKLWRSKLEALPSPLLKLARSSRFFRPSLYVGGLPALGLKTEVRFLAALAVAALACAAAYLLPQRLTAPPPAAPSAAGLAVLAAAACCACACAVYLFRKRLTLRPRVAARSVLLLLTSCFVVFVLSYLVALVIVQSGYGNTNSANVNLVNANAGNTNAGNTNAGNMNTGNMNAGNTNAGNTNAGNMNGSNMNGGGRQNFTQPVNVSPSAAIVDRFNPTGSDDEQARLSRFADQLRQDPKSTGLVAVYGDNSRNSATRIRDLVAKTSGDVSPRVSVVAAGGVGPDSFYLYVTPSDARAPSHMSGDRKLRWDIHDGKLLVTDLGTRQVTEFSVGGDVSLAAFSPDNSSLAVASPLMMLDLGTSEVRWKTGVMGVRSMNFTSGGPSGRGVISYCTEDDCFPLDAATAREVDDVTPPRRTQRPPVSAPAGRTGGNYRGSNANRPPAPDNSNARSGNANASGNTNSGAFRGGNANLGTNTADRTVGRRRGRPLPPSNRNSNRNSNIDPGRANSNH